MAVERKCPICKAWNKDEDHCLECGRSLAQISLKNYVPGKESPYGKGKKQPSIDLFYVGKLHGFYS